MSDRFNPQDLHNKGFEPDGNGGYRKVRKAAEPEVKDISAELAANQRPVPIKQVVRDFLKDPNQFDKIVLPHEAIRDFIKDGFAKAGLNPKHLPTDEDIAWANQYLYKPEIETRYFELEVDNRGDMIDVAKNYLIRANMPTRKRVVREWIVNTRKQEADALLANLKPSVDFYIPVEVRSTKNHKQILRKLDGTPFIAKAFATMRQENITRWDYKMGAAYFRECTQSRDLPLFLKFTFIMSIDAPFDFQNIVQGPLDQMQKYGWLLNDNRKCVVPIFNPRVYIHPEKVGVIITIL